MSLKGLSKKEATLEDFLTEFARFLLAAGISFPQFESVAQAAYVNAALERTKLRNARINQSAVAALTGLSRTTIRAILRGSRASRSSHRGYLPSLVFGWTNDPEFLTTGGIAKKLPLKGSRASFQRLAQMYGGDVSERALLVELKRLKLVVVRADEVRLRVSSVEGRFARELKALTVALTRTLQRPTRVGDAPLVSVSGGEVSYPAPSVLSRVLLRRRVRQGLNAFLDDIRTSAGVTTKAATRVKRKNTRMSKLSVLVVSQD